MFDHSNCEISVPSIRFAGLFIGRILQKTENSFGLVGHFRFVSREQAVAIDVETLKRGGRSEKLPLRNIAVAIAVHSLKPERAGCVVANCWRRLGVRRGLRWIGGQQWRFARSEGKVVFVSKFCFGKTPIVIRIEFGQTLGALLKLAACQPQIPVVVQHLKQRPALFRDASIQLRIGCTVDFINIRIQLVAKNFAVTILIDRFKGRRGYRQAAKS